MNKMKNYEVTVRLKKSYVLVDYFPKRPTKEDCIEIFIDALTSRELDEDLEVKVRRVKEKGG